jgi:hypothetical protein
MNKKNIKNTENQAFDFVKSLNTIIEDGEKYNCRNEKYFQETKEFMKKNHPELFLNEDSEDNIVFDFCEKKHQDVVLAYNLKKTILDVIENHK